MIDLLELQRKMEEQLLSNAEKSYNQSLNVTKNLKHQKIVKSKLPVENKNRLVLHLKYDEKVLRSNSKKVATNKKDIIPNKLNDKNDATEINNCQLTNAIIRNSKIKKSLNLAEEFQSGQFIQPTVGITNIRDCPIIKPLSHKEHITTLTKHNMNELTNCANKNEIYPPQYTLKPPQNKNQFSNHLPYKSSFFNSNCTATDNFKHEHANTSSLSVVPSISNNNNIHLSECSAKLESFKTLSSTHIDENFASEYIPDSISRDDIDNFQKSKSVIHMEKVVIVENIIIPNKLVVKNSATEISDCQLTNAITRSSKNKQSLNFTDEYPSFQFIQPIDTTNIQDSPVIKPLRHKEHMTTLTKHNTNDLTKCANKIEIFPVIKHPQNKNQLSNSPDASSFFNSDCTATDNF